MPNNLGIAGWLAKTFLRSKLTPLFVLASLLGGVAAVILTPKEEEPQIVVPMVDVLLQLPGATPQEIESQLTTPLERRFFGIPGVEFVYSTSHTGSALITVRFKVNEPLEASLIKVRQELDAHPELRPSSALPPVVRLLTIDDVPFLTLTLHGGDLPSGELRKLGEEVALKVSEVPDTAQVSVLGGARHTVQIEPNLERMRSLSVSFLDLLPALKSADAQASAGSMVDEGGSTLLRSSGFIRSPFELARLVVATRNGLPIYLSDVASVTEGPEREPAIVLVTGKPEKTFEQAVSLVVAKRRGTNATQIADKVLGKIAVLRGRLIPHSVRVEVTRNYGESAADKSRELIEHLLIATFAVVTLIFLAMGWRAAAVVGIAVPVTLSLTLLLTYLLGYTLNRVTLFALIFSIGILVDDAIVVIENIHRHLHLPGRSGSLSEVIITAVEEVGRPTILATFAVIGAILPMALVGGLMGPYMRPIPIGASLAMLFSLAVAFIVSPWAALKLAPKAEKDVPSLARQATLRETRLTRLYRRVISTLLHKPLVRWVFFGGVLLLLGLSSSLVGFGWVKVKMLPFDNKNEFQVQLDLPQGTAREDSIVLGQKLAQRLMAEPEISGVQLYSGVAAPFTFLGLVRHSFLRESAGQIDLQVNLVPKGQRHAQSHDITARVRPVLEELMSGTGATLKLVEIPPGPPVLDTLVGEIYGPTRAERDRYARKVFDIFHSIKGIVDTDSSLTATGPISSLVVDREKAALHGVAPIAIAQTLSGAAAGMSVGSLHVERGATQVPLILKMAPEQRARIDQLLELTIPGTRGAVPLGELIRVQKGWEEPDIFHKNLLPLSYVFGDLAGDLESPVYALLQVNRKLDANVKAPVRRSGLSQPEDTESLFLKWDGEWHITLEVFRDLGLAFGAVIILIYVLMVGWFESFSVPLVILVPVPLSLIGILPAHGLFQMFFTATSMIGFIAGAGIIVRNSIILVDFIELKVKEGMPLDLAVEEAGVVRFRPMLLTAAAVLAGSAVMLTDPIFQGLALSLMAGEVAATLLSRLAVPVLYYLLARKRPLFEETKI